MVMEMEVHIFVAMNQDAINNQKSHLNKGASVIYDPAKINVDSIKDNKDFKLVPIPMLDIAVKVSGVLDHAKHSGDRSHNQDARNPDARLRGGNQGDVREGRETRWSRATWT